MLESFFGLFKGYKIKPIRDMKHSPHVPEFFIPRGPYKAMATGNEQLKKRSRLVKRITLSLEWAYYFSVICFCTYTISYMSGMLTMFMYP